MILYKVGGNMMTILGEWKESYLSPLEQKQFNKI